MFWTGIPSHKKTGVAASHNIKSPRPTICVLSLEKVSKGRNQIRSSFLDKYSMPSVAATHGHKPPIFRIFQPDMNFRRGLFRTSKVWMAKIELKARHRNINVHRYVVSFQK